MLWSAFISLVQLGVYVKCFSNETGYETPAGWHGNVNSDELRRVITDENVTIPGFDPMMMNKFRGFMGQVQTLNDDNDATVSPVCCQTENGKTDDKNLHLFCTK